MSDGMSDCADEARRKADEYIERELLFLNRVNRPEDIPMKGSVLLAYEEWLTCVVEVITDRQVKKRVVVPAFGLTYELPVTGEDFYPGYYGLLADHRLPRTPQEETGRKMCG